MVIMAINLKSIVFSIISNDSKVVIFWTTQIFYKTSANLNGVTVLRSYVGINERVTFVSYNQIRAVRL